MKATWASRVRSNGDNNFTCRIREMMLAQFIWYIYFALATISIALCMLSVCVYLYLFYELFCCPFHIDWHIERNSNGSNDDDGSHFEWNDWLTFGRMNIGYMYCLLITKQQQLFDKIRCDVSSSWMPSTAFRQLFIFKQKCRRIFS